MKKILFLLIAIVVTATVFAQQPTVTIDNVVPGTKDGHKGDYITFTVHSEAASGWSCTFLVDFGKCGKGGAGGYGYPESELFSHTAITLTRFCGLQNSYANKERTWTVNYSYIPDDQTSDPYPWIVSDTYTVTK
jgi:hypothetical protein